MTEKRMTVKEVAEVLGVTPEAVKEWIRELFPDKMKNGVVTYLDEIEVTAIKLKMRPTTKVVAATTELEKTLIIQQAMGFLQERVEILKTENSALKSEVKMLTHDDKTYTTTEIAKELHMRSAQELNKHLVQKNIIYMCNGSYVLKATYSQKGYSSLKQEKLANGKVVYNLHWTGTGRQFLLDFFGQKNLNIGVPR